jgi:hypothetical protein
MAKYYSFQEQSEHAGKCEENIRRTRSAIDFQTFRRHRVFKSPDALAVGLARNGHALWYCTAVECHVDSLE